MFIPNVSQNLVLDSSQSPGAGRPGLGRISNTCKALTEPAAGAFASVQNQIVRYVRYRAFFALIFFISTVQAVDYTPTPARRKALYTGMDPCSVSQHLAFYRLFPETEEGKKALDDALSLLSKGQKEKVGLYSAGQLHLPVLEELVQIVNRPPQTAPIKISPEELNLIDQLASHLKNRSLKGFRCSTLAEAQQLPSEEIDLGRALILSQMGDKVDLDVVLSYEAVFDLMALQILARLKDAKPRSIIAAMNRFIFDEMHYRFPPQSLFMDDIDLYTFLPSVVDSRRGVCLGVSILYLCLAQRIGLNLSIITPPGHIFVRYDEDGEAINIETTARGIDIPDEHYLSLENKELTRRTLKEVVGMAHVNHASTLWHRDENRAAIQAYEAALPYMPDDPLVKELLAYNYLIAGDLDKGKKLLKELVEKQEIKPMESYRVAEDFLHEKVDVEGIKATFDKTEKARSTLEAKQKKIEAALKKYPEFREGWIQLAVLYLQMEKQQEAIDALTKFHLLDQTEPMVEYYLSVLHLQRLDYKKAWHHFAIVSKLLDEIDYHPSMLKELKLELMKNYLDVAYEDLY